MNKVRINGKEYHCVVLRVTGWDEKGRPGTTIIGYDDTSFDLRDDNVSREFITAFVPVDATAPKSRN